MTVKYLSTYNLSYPIQLLYYQECFEWYMFFFIEGDERDKINRNIYFNI
jgi:hypothetical protein